ncbi:C2H2 type zinc finger domain-containing [Fusarium albosuccineum]|uniref:C2H2 type zinc finger domain-containing n=1 Tax=Fusarium albosuccineum TaxID=1237068 RepID=A0A8H4LCM0_9HYPO|nr:C2H2 type zinc finger domain-containing [Fusarium albosuccineum]
MTHQGGSLAADPGDEGLSLVPDIDLQPESMIDIDSLVFPTNEPHFADYGAVSRHSPLEQPDIFGTSLDDLWSASLAQIPPDEIIAGADKDEPMNDGSSPPKEGLAHATNSHSSPQAANSGSSTATTEALASSRNPSLPPKIGHRFTRESARVLKRWFSAHNDHPYPSEEEKTMLQCKTGLSKTQVTNWLANARRRRTVDNNAHGSSSKTGRSGSGPDNTPRRAGTPIPRSTTSYHNMDPLQRWVDSPPEHEPAAASAIARAVASRHTLPSLTRRNTGSSDEGSSRRRRHASSGSSFVTSSGSTDSRSSKGSISASSSLSRGRSYRRRRTQTTSLAAPRHAFQCTFCTETFRTKYDWQRHENSLHLPLERWVCSPNGPSVANPETGQTYCVFCGKAEPDETHLATHNPAACQERSFSRKDHLKQHLRLVHNAGLIELSMKLWKAEKPDIRSNCGFCKATIYTWPDRVDHLANHFKLGCTMADWSGDWGFEDSVLETLENAMPPYLIDFERGTPFPFEASGKPPDSPRSAYELITIELAYFIQSHYDTSGDMPNNRRLQLEACRIVFASEVMFPEQNPDSNGGFSWLRDLILAKDEITQQARFGPIRSRAESRLSLMKIKGKNALFEACPLESHLHAFVHGRRANGVFEIQDHELQKEACSIITRMEGDLGTTPDFVANWLVTLISQSTNWLNGFRQRANLFRNQGSWNTAPQAQQSLFSSWSGKQNSESLQDQLFKDLDSQSWINTTSMDLSNNTMDVGQSGIEFGELPNEQNRSSSLIEPWLTNMPNITTSTANQLPTSLETIQPSVSTITPSGFADPGHSRDSPGTPGTGPSDGDSSLRPAWLKSGIFILNDSNHHRWLDRELKRWVSATMSPNNPNCHVPSDEELRHQSRCLLFNDDDPWNQTAADSAQWLAKFKQDVGIL